MRHTIILKTVKLTSIGLLIWATSLWWPEINSILTLWTVVGLIAGLVLVVLGQLSEQLSRRQDRGRGDGSGQAANDDKPRPRPDPFQASPTRPLVAIQDSASCPTRPVLISAVSRSSSQPTRPIAV